MPKQSEIERMLVLLYRSNNASDCVGYTRPAGWLDKLSMAGLDELADILGTLKADVVTEISRRQRVGQTTFPLGEYVGEKAVN
jgi:hypothetical protein